MPCAHESFNLDVAQTNLGSKFTLTPKGTDWVVYLNCLKLRHD